MGRRPVIFGKNDRSFRRALFLVCGVAIASPSFLFAQLPAFPGAEGFGTGTPGGRGGKVLKVTSLEDSGPGSFREACDQDGPRMVVFAVSGTIRLESDIVLENPFITIAGQTAPGEGITLTNYPFQVRTHDVVIRGIRFRMGDSKASRSDLEKNLKFESLHIIGGSRGVAYNVVVDHCSISWGIDKNIGVWGRDQRYGMAIHDITIQWCISSESLNTPLHPKGSHHAMGMVFSGIKGASAHHNLIAHSNARNPQFSKYTEGEMINNVVYDWGSYGAEIQGGARVNVIGNYFKPGKDWNGRGRGINVAEETRYGKVVAYVRGNIGPGRESDEGDDWSAVNGSGSFRSTDLAIPATGITVQTAQDAYESVLASAGALPRDAIDRRIIDDVRNGTGSLIASQDDVGGLPELKGGPVPQDSDNDGMPDEWETAHHLDPHNGDDAAGDRDGDGYTNVEEYVNSLIPAK